ncbi:MAG TPA: acylphosphatase [Allosphingosinicella sp.]|nr:acylphosphatase [Allosphingosinicella sp.]
MSRRLTVTGRVQGVWYRGWTVEQAEALGLDGWVRNRENGSVEILVAGPDVAVEELIRRCHRGPSAARVERVEVTASDEIPPAGFALRPTA